MKRNTIIVLLVVIVCVVLGVGIYSITKDAGTDQPAAPEVATTTPEIIPDVVVDDTKTVIGQSVKGTDITAYHYGAGDTEVLFVGGIHGGYAWNTVSVAQELMEYLEDNTDAVPANLRVTVIPVLNPDGLGRVVGTTSAQFSVTDVSKDTEELVSGRFNGNNVDLNRNFECEWSKEAIWQNKSVNPGSAAFSEPESKAFRAYVEAHDPKAVVVWYSAAGGVFASSCRNGVSEETKKLTDLYSKASGYRAYQEFNFYEITGDMVNWLARENIPAISVLLTNHQDVEWAKNQKGIEAILNHYAR